MARRSALGDTSPTSATQPCKAMAGTPERIATYRARVERGEAIFHPSDNWEVQVVSLAFKPKESAIREISLGDLVAV